MRAPSKRFILLTAAVVVVAAAGITYAAVVSHRSPHSTTINPLSGPAGSVAPSAGQSGNSGDSAKTDIANQANQQSASTTPVPVASSSPIVISSFNLTPQSNGQLYVASQLSGTSSGNCTLVLTSPSSNAQTTSGSVDWDGHYHFCSFGTITGVSDSGTWTGKLTVLSSGASASATSTFKVSN